MLFNPTEYATAKMMLELAIWRMYGDGDLTAELRDGLIKALDETTPEQIAADMAADATTNATGAAAPK